MADIYLSHHGGAKRVLDALTGVLTEAGHTVQFEPAVAASAAGDPAPSGRVGASPVVVVAWSDAALDSARVYADADEADVLNKLINISIDRSLPPDPFDRLHCHHLDRWLGDGDDERFQLLLADIARIAQRAEADHAPARQMPRKAGPDRLWLHVKDSLSIRDYELFLSRYQADPRGEIARRHAMQLLEWERVDKLDPEAIEAFAVSGPFAALAAEVAAQLRRAEARARLRRSGQRMMRAKGDGGASGLRPILDREPTRALADLRGATDLVRRPGRLKSRRHRADADLAEAAGPGPESEIRLRLDAPDAEARERSPAARDAAERLARPPRRATDDDGALRMGAASDGAGSARTRGRRRGADAAALDLDPTILWREDPAEPKAGARARPAGDPALLERMRTPEPHAGPARRPAAAADLRRPDPGRDLEPADEPALDAIRLEPLTAVRTKPRIAARPAPEIVEMEPVAYAPRARAATVEPDALDVPFETFDAGAHGVPAHASPAPALAPPRSAAEQARWVGFFRPAMILPLVYCFAAGFLHLTDARLAGPPIEDPRFSFADANLALAFLTTFVVMPRIVEMVGDARARAFAVGGLAAWAVLLAPLAYAGADVLHLAFERPLMSVVLLVHVVLTIAWLVRRGPRRALQGAVRRRAV